MFSILRIIMLAVACITLNAYVMAQPADEPIPATGENPGEDIGADSIDESGGAATIQTAADSVDFLLKEPNFNQIIPELSAKDAEFQNIIRLIALKTGLNILLNPDEIDGKKRITFQLKNVRLGAALDTILKTQKLAYIVEAGNIIRIVPESRVGRDAVETVTEIIELNWRDGRDMESTFKGFLSGHGSIKSNDETQTLIITDVPPNVVKIRELISQIDKPDRQVVIEARLVDVQVQAGRSLQNQWSFAKANDDIFGFDEDFTGQEAIPVGTKVEDVMAILGIEFPATVEGIGWNGDTGQMAFGSEVSIFGQEYDLNAALQFLESRDIVEIVAAPRVTTLNNVSATIDITSDIPYIQGEIVSTQSVVTVRFQQVGERIIVKPIITPDKHIRLDISVQQTIFRGRAGSDLLAPPITDDRKAKSTVIVKDRNTVVLGGLRGLRNSENVDAWPWLWRIPVIGWAFKDKVYDKEKRNLALLVTPTIVEQAILNTDEKSLYDMLDVKWESTPGYFMDDTKTFDDTFDNSDCDLPFHGGDSASE